MLFRVIIAILFIACPPALRANARNRSFKIRFGLILSILFIAISANSQTNLFSFLSADTLSPTSIFPIKRENKIVQIDDGLKCEPAYHNYLVKKGKLFIHFDGTGRIYTIDSANKPNRLDNTCYEGYNFYAYNFVYNDTIHSFSGWGFWKYDGGLRFYDERNKEWYIKSISQKIGFAQNINALVWQDIKADKIYVVYKQKEDSYFTVNTKVKDTFLVQCFDIPTKTWWPKAKELNASDPFINYQKTQIFTTTPWGILAEHKEGIRLYDFRNNQVSYIKQNIIGEIASLILKNSNGFIINRKDKIYIYNPSKDTIINMNLSSKDLIALPEAIYSKENSDKWNYWYATLLLFILPIIYYVRKKKRQPIVSDVVNSKEPISTVSFYDSLTAQEKLVLDLIMTNSKKELYTSIEDINRVLGTKSKDVAIQKNIRAEVLSKINEKYQLIHGTNTTLIERERTEYDKRVYQYKVKVEVI